MGPRDASAAPATPSAAGAADPRPVGAILAGGASRRMGFDKALAMLDGTPFVLHVAAALEAAGCEAMVVGRSAPLLGVAAIPDLPGSGGGPAHGLLTALTYGGRRPVVLAAVDQPLLRAATVQALASLPGDAVVPVEAGVPQVTCAVYREQCVGPLRALLDGAPDASLRSLLPAVAATLVPPKIWGQWGEDGGSWSSVDTPEALSRLRRRRSSSGRDRPPGSYGSPW